MTSSALHVDLQFERKGSEIDSMIERYGPSLEPGMAIQKAYKSAVVRIEIPRVDVSAPFLESEPAVREAIWAAKLLLLWYRAQANRP